VIKDKNGNIYIEKSILDDTNILIIQSCKYIHIKIHIKKENIIDLIDELKTM